MSLLSDVQKAVISRPLTYWCSSDIGLFPLTPYSFIHPNTKINLSKLISEMRLIPKQLQDLFLLGKKFKEMWYENICLVSEDYLKIYIKPNFPIHSISLMWYSKKKLLSPEPFDIMTELSKFLEVAITNFVLLLLRELMEQYKIVASSTCIH